MLGQKVVGKLKRRGKNMCLEQQTIEMLGKPSKAQMLWLAMARLWLAMANNGQLFLATAGYGPPLFAVAGHDQPKVSHGRP